MRNQCLTCDHYRPGAIVNSCYVGMGGLFRLAVMSGKETCPAYEKDERIISVKEISTGLPSKQE